MNRSHVVMLAYFDRTESVPYWPDLDTEDQFYGLPLWKWPADGQWIGIWAIDYVVLNDERSVAFGPYESKEMARVDFLKLPAGDVLGYRIFDESLFEDMLEDGEYEPRFYTDG